MPDRDIPTATPPSINRKISMCRFSGSHSAAARSACSLASRCKQIPGASRPARLARDTLTDTLRNQPASVRSRVKSRHALPERYRRRQTIPFNRQTGFGNVSHNTTYASRRVPGTITLRCASRDNAPYSGQKQDIAACRRQMFMNALYFAYAG